MSRENTGKGNQHVFKTKDTRGGFQYRLSRLSMMSHKVSNPPNRCFPVALKFGRLLSRADSVPLPNSAYMLLLVYVYLLYETWNNPAV